VSSQKQGIERRNVQTELRRSLVLLIIVLPFCEREQGEDACDRTPLGNTQSGLGETCHTYDESTGSCCASDCQCAPPFGEKKHGGRGWLSTDLPVGGTVGPVEELVKSLEK
jgi:hypothetical protein